MMWELLKARVDLNMKNRFGATPLYEPVLSNNEEALKLLLEFVEDDDIR